MPGLRAAARPGASLTRCSVAPWVPASAVSASRDCEAERDQRVTRLQVRIVGGRRARAVAGGDRLERRRAELVAQLHDDALGRALADARDRRQQRQVAGRDAPLQRVHRIAGEQRERLGRPEPRDAEQRDEEPALPLRREAVERERVLAHDEVRLQLHGLRMLARGACRGRGGMDAQPDAPHLHHQAVGVCLDEAPGQARNHRAALARANRASARALQAWQRASASASAAWSLSGASGSESSCRTMRMT